MIQFRASLPIITILGLPFHIFMLDRDEYRFHIMVKDICYRNQLLAIYCCCIAARVYEILGAGRERKYGK